jgi:hypothetical protein
MNETPEQIENHIRHTREDLSANLNELEQKVKSATDWRQHYAKSPVAFLATAVTGGVLLAFAIRGHRPRAGTPPMIEPYAGPRRVKERGQLDESMGVIKGALIGLAADQAKGLLSRLLPGFAAQLQEHDRPKARRPTGAARPPADGADGASNIG